MVIGTPSPHRMVKYSAPIPPAGAHLFSVMNQMPKHQMDSAAKSA